MGSNVFIIFSNYVNVWSSKGWNFGMYDYQIMVMEGFQSSGRLNLIVWQLYFGCVLNGFVGDGICVVFVWDVLLFFM